MRGPISDINELLELSKTIPEAQSVTEVRDAFSDIREVRGNNCGDAGGVFLGLHNSNRGQRIQVYYEVSSNMNGPWQRNVVVGPGQTAWVVCSATRTDRGTQYFYIRKTGAHYV